MKDTTSLLTEHFSYTPLSLIDDIINSVNNLIYQAISSLEDGLQGTPPERLGFKHDPNTIPDTDDHGNILYPEARLEIENGLHQLETLLETTVDKAFDKLEIYVLRNILTVPEDLASWIRLSHHEGLSFEPTNPNAPTPDSITNQRKQLRETKKLNRLLTRECARNDAILAQLRSILTPPQSSQGTTIALPDDANGKTQQNISLGPDSNSHLPNLSFLLSDPRTLASAVGHDETSSSHGPLTTNTTFILSQLPALRAMLLQLRPKLATLPAAVEHAKLDPRRTERREYIDTRTRLHIERMGSPSGD
ncbi:hypothetical protein FQN57_000146 [Myotisia sp. PD_48]|nr:hypothetical protein FQN57_000146 [Myotisia sp. PD_48]